MLVSRTLSKPSSLPDESKSWHFPRQLPCFEDPQVPTLTLSIWAISVRRYHTCRPLPPIKRESPLSPDRSFHLNREDSQRENGADDRSSNYHRVLSRLSSLTGELCISNRPRSTSSIREAGRSTAARSERQGIAAIVWTGGVGRECLIKSRSIVINRLLIVVRSCYYHQIYVAGTYRMGSYAKDLELRGVIRDPAACQER